MGISGAEIKGAIKGAAVGLNSFNKHLGKKVVTKHVIHKGLEIKPEHLLHQANNIAGTLNGAAIGAGSGAIVGGIKGGIDEDESFIEGAAKGALIGGGIGAVGGGISAGVHSSSNLVKNTEQDIAKVLSKWGTKDGAGV